MPKLTKSGYIATRPLRVGHGHVQAGEAFPETPTHGLIHSGMVEKGDGPLPADPLVGIYDAAEAEAIRQELAAADAGDEGDVDKKPRKRKSRAAADAGDEGDVE